MADTTLYTHPQAEKSAEQIEQEWVAAWRRFDPIWNEACDLNDRTGDMLASDPRKAAARKADEAYMAYMKFELDNFLQFPAPNMTALNYKLAVASHGNDPVYAAELCSNDLQRLTGCERPLCAPEELYGKANNEDEMQAAA